MTRATKTSLLGFFTVLIIAVLCLVLASTPPLQASAARKTKYISEIKFADDHDVATSEAWLKNNGYTMLESELGSNNYGSVGVKYTTDPDKALTDIKVMNMKGGYSFAEYESFLERETAISEDLVKSLSGGIAELQRRKDTPGGQVARKMLNYFYEDDSQMHLGDYLLDHIDVNVKDDQKALSKIFMQGNGAANSVIRDAIAIGCLDEGGQNWMQAASALSIENNGDLSSLKTGTEHSVKAGYILDIFKVLRKDLKFYQEWYAEFQIQFKDVGTPGKDENGNDIINYTDEETKLIDESINGAFKNKQMSFVTLSSIHVILSNTPYKDNKFPNVKNLADLIIESDKLQTTDLIPIAQYFTPVQAEVINVVGLQRFILNAENTKEHWDEVLKQTNELELTKDLKKSSVYEGVDRTMFTADGIAMTSDAIRQNLITPEDNPFLGNLSQKTEQSLFTFMVLTGIVAFGAMVYSIGSGWGNTIIKAGSDLALFIEDFNVNGGIMYTDDIMTLQKEYPTSYGYKLTMSAKIFMGAMAVLLIIAIVFLTLELVNYYDQEMTRMPSAIMDNQYKDGKNNYFKYDALTVHKDNKDKPYDYNNEVGRQWQIIYASKDKRAGSPITEIKFDTSTSTYQSSHKPVALFGETAARDLKKYGPISVATKYEYMFFKQDTKAYPATGSVFNAGTFILTLCGGILGGAALGILGAYLFIKAKKAKNKAEPITQTTTEN